MHQPPHLRFRAFEELPFIVYEDVMGLPRVVDYSTCPPLNEPRQLNPPPHTEELSVVKSLPLELPGELRVRLKERLDTLGYHTEIHTKTVDLPSRDAMTQGHHEHSLKRCCSIITVHW